MVGKSTGLFLVIDKIVVGVEASVFVAAVIGVVFKTSTGFLERFFPLCMILTYIQLFFFWGGNIRL